MKMAAFGNQTVVLAKAQDSVEQAVVTLDKSIAADNSYDDLSKMLRIYKETTPNESGLNDHDYPTLTSEQLALPPLPELSTNKRVPLPNELVEQFSRMQCNCMMGLFPEISRAWLTIDSDVFVWNYDNGGDLAYFDGLNETILSCGLVKPKPGIFQPYVSQLMILTTPVEIVLLGVTFVNPVGDNVGCNPKSSDMHLLPDPLYSIQSDNVHFLTVRGTESGRVFLGARDGCLYEVIYQADDGWFSKKCRKINLTSGSMFSFISFTPSFMKKEEEPIVQIEVDESASILYTRSEKGSIQVYDLGADGNNAEKIIELPEKAIVSKAAQILRTVDKSNFENIIHIAALPRQESTNLHLVAVTSSGVRLYFCVKPFAEKPESRPNTLMLVHVRLPPGFSASTTSQRPSKVHLAHYNRGNLLMVSSQSDDVDILWAMSPDCFPFQTQMMESQISMSIGGRTWALTEEPNAPVMWSRDPGLAGFPKCNPPLVVTQHMEDLRRFVLLTAQGSYIMHKMRPVDQLRSLLVKGQGYDSREVEAFFKLHKQDQACATCLILICSRLFVDAQVSEWATGAFFQYGGEPLYQFGSVTSNFGSNYAVIGADMSAINPMSPARSFHPNQVSTPHPSHNGIAQPVPLSAGVQGIVLSGKHDGIYLYLARILGPVWDSKLLAEVTQKSGKGTMLTSRVSLEELAFFIDNLASLLSFIEKNSQYISALTSESFMPAAHRGLAGHIDESTRRQCQAEAISKEKQSLQHVTVLISRSIEVLSLWKLICEHQVHVVTQRLADPHKTAVKTATLKTLVLNSSGEQLFNPLISGVMQQYIGDNASTDAISARLREVCPSLYSVEAAKCSKADEILQSVKTSQNRTEALQAAMQLYREVSPNFDLQHVCEQLAGARHFSGILDLCLTTATRKDAQNIALHYYNAGESADDQQGYSRFAARLECYNCVLNALKFLLNTCNASVKSSNIPTKAGPPTQTPDVLTSAEADHHVESLYQQALKSKDELFHVRLYEWMTENNLTDKLLQISSPYLENYLVRNSRSLSPDVQLQAMDLLWKFYEKNKNFGSASQILSRLADRSSGDIALKQRVEYLSRAVMSAKSATYRIEGGDEEFRQELEERLEVARVQCVVLEALSKIQPRNARISDALRRLNLTLLDITTLYGQYADPFDLPECKLAIIHCAGHHDTMLIETLWQGILDREFDMSERQSTDTRMAALQCKVHQLAQLYGTSDKFFPLSFIVKHMEILSIKAVFLEDWVYATMLKAGVPLLRLLDVYNKMFKAKDPCWKNLQRPYHILSVVNSLLRHYLANLNVLSAAERQRLIASSSDTISAYLIELESSTLGDPRTSKLASSFRELQAKIKRSSAY